MQQIVLSGQWAVWHQDPATVKLRAYTGVRKVLFTVKKRVDAKETKGVLPLSIQTPSLASLSLT